MINAVKGCRALALGAIAVLITVGVSPLAAQECRSDWETCDHARVEHYIKQFTKRTWRGWLHGVWERSWIYADHIGAALERRGLPQELRLLPVVESAYREDAVSPQGAVGLWQITRVGASGYPLRMGGPIDERRDFWKATEVALDTLATNHDRFGDWLLAIAAYNAGPGGVQRAINRAGTTDFWELRRSGALPRETAEFVPRFLAAVRVFAQPERYGLSEMEPITWVRVGAGGRADLRKLAAHTGMDLQLLRTANAELSSLFTPSDARVEPVVIGSNDARAADMRGYWLKVPEEHAEEVRALLQERTQLFDFIEHEVRPGETFWDMAKRYGSSVELIVDENPDLHPRRLRLSQTVIIPLLAGAPIVQPQPLTMEWFAQSGSGAVYEVEYGDSLWGIARTHGVTVEALAASNGRSPHDIIKPGETLMVQAGSTLSSA
jgi:membrane-bound lytic murein transglycosylase D